MQLGDLKEILRGFCKLQISQRKHAYLDITSEGVRLELRDTSIPPSDRTSGMMFGYGNSEQLVNSNSRLNGISTFSHIEAGGRADSLPEPSSYVWLDRDCVFGGILSSLATVSEYHPGTPHHAICLSRELVPSAALARFVNRQHDFHDRCSVQIFDLPRFCVGLLYGNPMIPGSDQAKQFAEELISAGLVEHPEPSIPAAFAYTGAKGSFVFQDGLLWRRYVTALQTEVSMTPIGPQDFTRMTIRERTNYLRGTDNHEGLLLNPMYYREIARRVFWK